MSLVAGARLGPYEVVSLIGAGGMGEVYRARDTKLNRDVAVKVLPEPLAHDPERLARFEREAQVLASLNHPHIAHVHGFDDSTVPALVMELVEGPTLADRIAKGPIPIDEALAIARQIAEALEAAHEQGIIHRDLKPANIKVRDDGTVKVLDFGLAKLLETETAASPLTMSPTLSLRGTYAGVILGTAAYMSPEQARGRRVDRRTDIWAFGCVLFEMLTGRTPFDVGDTVSDAIAAILKNDADWSRLPSETPANVRILLKRCLQKDAQRRLPHIGLVPFEIDEAADEPAPTVPVPAASPSSRWRRALPIVGAAVVASALTGLALWWRLPRSAPSPVVRLTLLLPEGQQFTNTGRRVVAMSPDGTRVAYVANRRLYIRAMDSIEARPIAGIEGSGTLNSPAFSPNGQAMAFVTDSNQTIKRVPVDGGTAVTVYHADAGIATISWDASGIVFAQRSRVMRVSSTGGQTELLARAENGEAIQSAQMLPGGRALLMTVSPADVSAQREDTAKIMVHVLSSGERRVLSETGSDAQYVSSGHIVYALGGTLFALPFDVNRFVTIGGPGPALEGVRRAGSSTVAQFGVSLSGSLVFIPGPPGTSSLQSELAMIDRSGRIERRLRIPAAPYESPRISPDGTRIAVATDDGKDANVWIYDLSETKAIQRLTFEGRNRFPVWSPDGQRVAFQSDREGDNAIFWRRADGTGPLERLTKAEPNTSHMPASFSPHGDTLLFAMTSTSLPTLWTLSLPDRKTSRFDDVKSLTASAAVFSPDGRWVVYPVEQSAASVTGIFVQPFPPNGETYQITRNRGRSPVWSSDGRELFYFVGPSQIEKADVTTRPSFSVGNGVPVPIGSPMQAIGTTATRMYDMAPDGTRFVGVITAGTNDAVTAAPHVEVVLNWLEELKARLPQR
jgi:eukaryotic-like serine/threonine-protein kinase